MPDTSKTVCYFGDYDPTYRFTKSRLDALALNGVKVLECRVDPRLPFFAKALSLFRAYRSLPSHDAVIVGFTDTRLLAVLARLFTTKPVLFDPGYPLYDGWVLDRKLVRKREPKALYYWIVDWLSFRAAHRILMPTRAGIRRVSHTYGIPERMFNRVPICADTDMFVPHPQRKADGLFRVEFHGKYIPVQGADVLVRAAKILESDPDMRFVMIGDGQEKQRVERLATELEVRNIEFYGFLNARDIVVHITEADVCIGLLGNKKRIEYSIPNKLYEAAAVGRACITADSEAVREFFTDKHDVLLVPPGNPEAVAEAIRLLKSDPALRQHLVKNIRETSSDLGVDFVGRELMAALGVVTGGV